MSSFKKAAAALLCLLMVLPAFAACSDDVQNPAETTMSEIQAETTASANTESETTLRSQVKDGVPADLTFNGAKVNVLHRDAQHLITHDVVGTDNSGDYVLDSVWYRNLTVEERLGIKFVFTKVSASGVTGTANAIRQIVMSDSSEFDYISTTGNTVITQGMDIYMRDVSNMPFADYDSPWWWKGAMDAVSLDGKSYRYLFGDSMLYCYRQTGVVYYNKALYGDRFGNPDEMYDFVLNNTWTIDKLTELTEACYADLNGNGIEDKGDRFGSLRTDTQKSEMQYFLAGFDLEMYHRNDQNALVIKFDEARCASAVEKLGKYNTATIGLFHSDKNIDGGSGTYFRERTSVFFPGRLYHVFGTFRTMDDPYGILPYPKLTEDQEDYVSLISDSGSVLCVPLSVPESRMNMVGATLEAVNAQSWRSVMPLFLESALKMKYSQDQMSGKVIDIVVAGLSKNTLYELADYSADIFEQVLVNPAISGNNNFASNYQKYLTAAQTAWDSKVKSTK